MANRLGDFRWFATRVWRRYVDEDFYLVSGSLAYTTLLSLVPLVAVVLGVISMLPFFPGIVKELDLLIAQTFLPVRNAGVIVTHLIDFSQKAANVTFVGLATLVAAVLFLLLSVERAFNRVWRVPENRSWWKKMRLAVVVLALWPLVVAGVILAIYHALTTSLGLLDDSEFLRSFAFKFAGLAVAALFFAALYATVPNARVRASEALTAGLFAAAAFIFMQKAFGFYLSLFPMFTLIYGAFATVPIFLIWLYLSWAVVIVGALVAATLAEPAAPWRAGADTGPLH